jgi:hypothetical protein
VVEFYYVVQTGLELFILLPLLQVTGVGHHAWLFLFLFTSRLTLCVFVFDLAHLTVMCYATGKKIEEFGGVREGGMG